MIEAVIFDTDCIILWHLKIGGVVLQSPFVAISEYERTLDLPNNYINCSITSRGPQGAWAKFERGEIELAEFYRQFGYELSDWDNGNKWYEEYCNRRGLVCPVLPRALEINGRELFGSMMRAAAQYDRHMHHALLKLRASGRHKLIALTNNFGRVNVSEEEALFLGWIEGPTPNHLREHFDDFCDSSTLGMRKPEPRFYLAACARNGIVPSQAIFLDDIGINLKVAKELGMATIRVEIGKTQDAVKELEERIGMDLTGPLLASRL